MNWIKENKDAITVIAFCLALLVFAFGMCYIIITSAHSIDTKLNQCEAKSIQAFEMKKQEIAEVHEEYLDNFRYIISLQEKKSEECRMSCGKKK